jgi:hypothetical protein
MLSDPLTDRGGDPIVVPIHIAQTIDAETLREEFVRVHRMLVAEILDVFLKTAAVPVWDLNPPSACIDSRFSSISATVLRTSSAVSRLL